jgi:holo-[acyl-carrier protein] synthase
VDILGIGTDIEKVARFRRLPYRTNRSFYERIFTSREIAYCLTSANPAERFAARFAAKEAFIKAAQSKIDFKKIEVAMKGKIPAMKVVGKEVFLSLSHSSDYAIAFVVIIKKNGKRKK